MRRLNTETGIPIYRIENTTNLFGNYDENIKQIEKAFSVDITNRDGKIKIYGESKNLISAKKVVKELMKLLNKGEALNSQNVGYIIDLVSDGQESELNEISKDVVAISVRGNPIRPKTAGQQRYVKAIFNNTITLGTGPAGTGKTYLAVACAVKAFKNGEYERIILTRPAVEAGEKLGFLPGDLQSKIDPYLRPLYDALFDLLGAETFNKYQERGNIEVAPLAYMRGRTLDSSFIILDEAQNTTHEQMKMFLTRLGFGSKMVIAGDMTQIDLPYGKTSGLIDAMRVLKNIDDISIIRFNEKDVVRHRLVQNIVKSYEKYEKKKREE